MKIEEKIKILQKNNIFEISKKEFCNSLNIDYNLKNSDLNNKFKNLPIKFYYNKIIIENINNINNIKNNENNENNENNDNIENNENNDNNDNIENNENSELSIEQGVYIKNVKEHYKYIIDEDNKKLFFNYIEKGNGNRKVKDNLVIPFKYLGSITSPLNLFEKLNWTNLGWFKKLLSILFIILIIGSVYNNIKNLIIYAIIYIIFFLLYLYNENNKNYLKLSVYTPSDENCYNLILLFDRLDDKNKFEETIKKYNNILLKTKTDFMNVKNSFINILKGKSNVNIIEDDNNHK